jgi:chromosome segregation ATPase
LEKEFKDSAVRFTKAKEKALGRVTELTTEIDTIQQMLDTGKGISPSRNSKNNRERLEKRLARLRSELTTRQNQLANTERAEQLLSERRNAQIERLEQLIQRQADTIEKVTAQNNRRTSTVDKVAGNFINTQVINNTYNQSFTSSNKNNFTQGNVNAYGSEGGEEYAMG